MDRLLIDQTIKEIGRAYEPGALSWMKKSHRAEWAKMLALEKKINKMALEKNMEVLREALSQYKTLILRMVDLFKGLHPRRLGGKR